MNIANILVNVALSSVTLPTPVITESATGIFPFSPSISQNDACTNAENIAKNLILQKTVGQTLSSDMTSECREASDAKLCKTEVVTVHSANGKITRVTDKHVSVEDWKCKVSITAEVEKNTPKGFDDFGVDITFDKHRYMQGEWLSFTFYPFEHSHVSLFLANKSNNTIKRVYPTPQKSNTFFYKNEIVHSSFLNKVKVYSDEIEETQFLLFVVTEKPVNFSGSYQLKSFYNMYDNINGNKQLYKKPFIVLGK
jgi:hypothetical protein